MTNPTSFVQDHIRRLFPAGEHEEVARLLREDCGAGLALLEDAAPEAFERVQCAALKLSEGRIDKLYDAIALAQTDWRDLLVCAGFAENTQAHKDWNR